MMFTLILTIMCYFSKDVRLPLQMQRAMAAEAEATREAKAKVRMREMLYIVELD